MARVHALLECLGLALCDKGRKALQDERPFGEVLPDIAKVALDLAHKELPSADLRAALGELASVEAGAYSEMLIKMVDGLSRVQSVPFRGPMIDYLSTWPATVRQVLRRPSDPTGKSSPEEMVFYKPDDLLVFLPPRRPRFHSGPGPTGLDDWQLSQLRGPGECSEVWVGMSEENAEHSPAALKFIIDPTAAAHVVAHEALFVKVFELNDQPGIVPLRNVYLETDPPCFDVGYVYGYDLAGLMFEWKWRFDGAKPEAALKLMRRLTEIVAKAHRKGVVHRDLKPSNILLHPTEGGKFTVWISDFGWGQIAAARSVELGRGGTPRGEQHRLALRGAHTPLYGSPQLFKKEPPTPQDDVHALGVIWYQMLKRDPKAAAPVGPEWADEFRSAGLTDSQAKLLSSCLATRAEKRPADASVLAELMANVTVAAARPAEPDGRVKSGSSVELAPVSGSKSGIYGRGGPMSGAMPAVVAMGHHHEGGLPRLITNSIGMTFALIPAGKFLMGSAEGEPGRRGDFEGPRHPVNITRPFYMCVFPVTQGQYERVTGKNPAHFTRAHGGGPDHPVESIGWRDAEQFGSALGLLPDEEIHGRGYRLPTEAEWEYACRAGTTTAYHFGDKLTPKQAQFAAPGAFAKTGGTGRTTPVGSFPPNAFGLYDMHGNVQEWVQDWYDDHYYHEAPPNDPMGPDRGQLKVCRGGCWAMFGTDCRSAARRPHAADGPSNAIGFRIVLMVPGKV